MNSMPSSSKQSGRKPYTIPILAAVSALISPLASACQVSADSERSTGNDEAFLRILSGPAWAQYDSATLVAEGHKACDAFAQGKTVSQVMETFQKDMHTDPGMAGHFIGAVTGGMDCYPQ